MAKRYGVEAATDDIVARSRARAADLIREWAPAVISHIPVPTLRRGLEIAQEADRRWAEQAPKDKRGHPIAQDNYWDARRHADWMWRTARELGPEFARFAGWAHELTAPNRLHARRMDEHNNAVAIDAAIRGVPYSVEDLQLNTFTVPRRVSGAPAYYLRPEHFPAAARSAADR